MHCSDQAAVFYDLTEEEGIACTVTLTLVS